MRTKFDVTFNDSQTMDVEFTQDSFVCDFGQTIPQGDYSGPYVVTPSEDTQVLATAGKTLESNVTVKPIPSNYGRITWNGTTITVS